MIHVDAVAFLVIVLVAAGSAVLVAAFARHLVIPVVVVEVVLGIVVGPQVLGWAQVDTFTTFFSDLGLGMLFFFAGYEIDFQRIRGTPLRLGGLGWIASLLIAHALAAVLWLTGMIDAPVYVACAMSTTAIGTLLPIVRDAGELQTPFGTLLLAAGAIGEFGPIVLLTVFLSTGEPLREAAILLAFVALALVAGGFAIRSAGRRWHVIERTLHASSQLAVRLVVLMVIALVALAYKLGLDLLLGGFMAGLIFRQAVGRREVEVLESKLIALGYGFLIPFFFVVSGMKFDLDALLGSATALVELPLFTLLFLVVRGGPVLFLYRDELDRRGRAALGLFASAQLPLVVAITAIAVDVGKMDAATAAALVGAGILSTLLFPLAALRLRRDAPAVAEAAPAAAGA
ncbi:MAG: cation:proton antiporter [Solirubrobacterales bacterium]